MPITGYNQITQMHYGNNIYMDYSSTIESYSSNSLHTWLLGFVTGVALADNKDAAVIVAGFVNATAP